MKTGNRIEEGNNPEKDIYDLELGISDSDSFRTRHNELLDRYGVEFQNNSDAWFATTGNIYTKDEVFICHITGIRYDEDGNWEGDLEGYLRLLEQDLSEWQRKIDKRYNRKP